MTSTCAAVGIVVVEVTLSPLVERAVVAAHEGYLLEELFPGVRRSFLPG